MKKLFLSIALFGFLTASAQTNQQANADKKEAKTEAKCEKKEGKGCCKKAKACAEKKDDAKASSTEKKSGN